MVLDATEARFRSSASASLKPMPNHLGQIAVAGLLVGCGVRQDNQAFGTNKLYVLPTWEFMPALPLRLLYELPSERLLRHDCLLSPEPRYWTAVLWRSGT